VQGFSKRLRLAKGPVFQLGWRVVRVAVPTCRGVRCVDCPCRGGGPQIIREGAPWTGGLRKLHLEEKWLLCTWRFSALPR